MRIHGWSMHCSRQLGGGGSGQLYLGHHPLENFAGYMHVLLKLKNQVKMSLPYPVHFRMAQNK